MFNTFYMLFYSEKHRQFNFIVSTLCIFYSQRRLFYYTRRERNLTIINYARDVRTNLHVGRFSRSTRVIGISCKINVLKSTKTYTAYW